MSCLVIGKYFPKTVILLFLAPTHYKICDNPKCLYHRKDHDRCSLEHDSLLTLFFFNLEECLCQDGKVNFKSFEFVMALFEGSILKG